MWQPGRSIRSATGQDLFGQAGTVRPRDGCCPVSSGCWDARPGAARRGCWGGFCRGPAGSCPAAGRLLRQEPGSNRTAAPLQNRTCAWAPRGHAYNPAHAGSNRRAVRGRPRTRHPCGDGWEGQPSGPPMGPDQSVGPGGLATPGTGGCLRALPSNNPIRCWRSGRTVG